jgi:hypothetical protein
MAKKIDNTVQKRNVLEELLGTVPSKKSKIGPKPGKETKSFKLGKDAKVAAKTAVKPGKEAKTKPSAPATPREHSTYKPEQRISVIRERECRAGTVAEQCWVLVRKSKTIGEYLSLRKKNNMGDGIGGWFGNFVKNKYISIR